MRNAVCDRCDWLVKSMFFKEQEKEKSAVCSCLFHIRLKLLPSGVCHKALEANLESFHDELLETLGLLCWTPCERLDQSCHVPRRDLVFTLGCYSISRSYGSGSRLAFLIPLPGILWSACLTKSGQRATSRSHLHIFLQHFQCSMVVWTTLLARVMTWSII